MNRKKQTTMKRFLLPHAFQKAGWGLLLASLVAGAAVLILGPISGPLPDGAVTADAAKTPMLTRTVICAAYISLLLIACSREKVEDEMVSAMRLRALAIVAYAALALYTVLTVAAIIADGDTAHGLTDTTVSLPILFWAYEALFRISIARNRKHTSL